MTFSKKKGGAKGAKVTAAEEEEEGAAPPAADPFDFEPTAAPIITAKPKGPSKPAPLGKSARGPSKAAKAARVLMRMPSTRP